MKIALVHTVFSRWTWFRYRVSASWKVWVHGLECAPWGWGRGCCSEKGCSGAWYSRGVLKEGVLGKGLESRGSEQGLEREMWGKVSEWWCSGHVLEMEMWGTYSRHMLGTACLRWRYERRSSEWGAWKDMLGTHEDLAEHSDSFWQLGKECGKNFPDFVNNLLKL